MADYAASPGEGGYTYESDLDARTVPSANSLTTLTNIAGAVISLALIVGVAIWGYRLLVRDVTGIPVVRAASGEMRVRPEDPGGQLAQHQGLSVNQVAAKGSAARPADRLQLAPQPVDLLPEDHLVAAAIEMPAPLDPTGEGPSAAIPDVTGALQAGNVDELVAQLTAGVAPMADLGESPEKVVASVTETVVAEVTAAEAKVKQVLEAPGVRRSLRPRKRPAVLAMVTPTSAPAAPAAETVEIDPNNLPAGTRLAQLGAFDSPEVAREQWEVMQKRFGTYMADKQRVVQKATSGGRVFYRLRAMGFADIGEARRFCSALVAENADCIPVVTR
ncbi:MAG: SPOR domain-containing protein [Sulfitobacter sp.]|nr:SPOR domain-containing protein [Sulfitobacter sp.]